MCQIRCGHGRCPHEKGQAAAARGLLGPVLAFWPLFTPACDTGTRVSLAFRCPLNYKDGVRPDREHSGGLGPLTHRGQRCMVMNASLTGGPAPFQNVLRPLLPERALVPRFPLLSPALTHLWPPVSFLPGRGGAGRSPSPPCRSLPGPGGAPGGRAARGPGKLADACAPLPAASAPGTAPAARRTRAGGRGGAGDAPGAGRSRRPGTIPKRARPFRPSGGT